MVSDIPAGEGKNDNLFLQCVLTSQDQFLKRGLSHQPQTRWMDTWMYSWVLLVPLAGYTVCNCSSPPPPPPPPHSVSKPDQRVSDTQETETERQVAVGKGGEGGGRGAESYDRRKKAWSSINHSILSAKKFLSRSRPSISNTHWIWGDLKKNGWYLIVLA